MSFVRALRCASGAPRIAHTASFGPRWLHSSAHRRAKKSSKKDDKLVFSSPLPVSEGAKKYVKPYTQEQRKLLAKKYTPEQLAAMDEGEAAVDPEDLYDQGMMRDGTMDIPYIDDFASIRPYVDHPIKPKEEHYDPNWRLKTDEELAEDLQEFVEGLPEDEDQLGTLRKVNKFFNETRMTVGKPEAELQATSSGQPPLPKLTDTIMRRAVRSVAGGKGGQNAKYNALLAKQSGWSEMAIKQLRMKKLITKRVSNQTRLGKVPKNWVLYIAGNGKGLLGIGEGSAVEPAYAVLKARRNAILNMVPIPRYENRTIYGDVKGKVGATELQLFNRPPGFGLRCQEKILEMCKCAGIEDISARVTRARNPMNTIKATMQALLKQRDPEIVSRARGRKMVDVRKVYYQGLIS